MSTITVEALLEIQEDNEVLTLISIQKLPNGDFQAESHETGNTGITPTQKANLLRWLADAIEIKGLPEHSTESGNQA